MVIQHKAEMPRTAPLEIKPMVTVVEKENHGITIRVEKEHPVQPKNLIRSLERSSAAKDSKFEVKRDKKDVPIDPFFKVLETGVATESLIISIPNKETSKAQDTIKVGQSTITRTIKGEVDIEAHNLTLGENNVDFAFILRVTFENSKEGKLTARVLPKFFTGDAENGETAAEKRSKEMAEINAKINALIPNEKDANVAKEIAKLRNYRNEVLAKPFADTSVEMSPEAKAQFEKLAREKVLGIINATLSNAEVISDFQRKQELSAIKSALEKPGIIK